MSEINMTRVFKNHQKMCHCLTFADTSWLKIPEFSDLKLSGSNTKEKLMRITAFSSKILR